MGMFVVGHWGVGVGVHMLPRGWQAVKVISFLRLPSFVIIYNNILIRVPAAFSQ